MPAGTTSAACLRVDAGAFARNLLRLDQGQTVGYLLATPRGELSLRPQPGTRLSMTTLWRARDNSPDEDPLAVKPNFFIVGAPKCGTTALYEYLRPHPNIFMPDIKEPHFFARDLGTYPRIKTSEEYAKLFTDSTEQHIRAGEASVYYLRSSVAVPNIHAFNPDARIIAMFRNPVDMVYSLHAQLLYVSEETESDFETAWRLQERRGRGIGVPPRIRSPLLVQYAQIGQFGTQTQRVLSCFPPSQVKLILYDDFAASPQQVYDEVIEFLGIPHDGRSEFPR